AILALGLLLAFLAGTQQIYDEIVDKNVEKLAMWDWLWEMAGTFSWVGIGRGAFESVSPAFQPSHGGIVYTHAENFVFQWVVEWGAPVALAAVVVFGWQLRPRRLGVGRSALSAGAWVGVAALLLHNLLDLALEVPAVMIALAVVVGSLSGDSRVHRASLEAPKLTEQTSHRVLMASSVVFVLALVGAGLMSIPDLATERKEVRLRLLASSPPRGPEQREALRTSLRDAMTRHPAEPYFPLAGAMVAWQDRSENPIPWIQRALERALKNGRAHLLLAYVLRDLGADKQALLELRLAVDADRELVGVAASRALAWATSVEELLVAVPTGVARAQSLDTLGRMASDRDVGRVLDRLALETQPELAAPRERLARDVISKLGSPECRTDDACDDQLSGHIAALEAANPNDSTAVRLRAERLIALGKADEAEQYLAEQCTKMDDRSRCLHARVRAAGLVDDRERLISAAKAWQSSVCAQRKRCAEAAMTIGDLHAGRREWGAAIENYKRAVREDESVSALSKLAGAASAAGMHAQAVRALERALKLPGGADDAGLKKRLATARQQLVRPLIGQ
ncbi:MAG: tetratricopeptide repeat protein, partial [Polyangiaceae bacterium]